MLSAPRYRVLLGAVLRRSGSRSDPMAKCTWLCPSCILYDCTIVNVTHAGQSLNLNCNGFPYSIKVGDTLSQLASKGAGKCSVEKIAEANSQIKNINVIMPGKVLCMPIGCKQPKVSPRHGPYQLESNSFRNLAKLEQRVLDGHNEFGPSAYAAAIVLCCLVDMKCHLVEQDCASLVLSNAT